MARQFGGFANYGYKKDRADHGMPDIKHLANKFKLVTIPKSVSYRDQVLAGPGIMDQGQVGSCFPAGTPILMGDFTERPIEEVGEGNIVRSHTGCQRQVTKVFCRSYEGSLYTLRVKGYSYPLTMTEEHPVAVVTNASKRPKWEYEPGDLVWREAKNLKPNDFILLPSPQDESGPSTLDAANYLEEKVWFVGDRFRLTGACATNTIPSQVQVSEEFARLIGLFLAEGSFRKRDSEPTGLSFTFARHEREYQAFVVKALKSIFGVDAETRDSESRPSVTDIRVDNSTLARLFFSLCGEYALGKRVPKIFYSSHRSVRIALLRGWLEGDGAQKALYTGKMSASLVGKTSSEELHRGLFRISLSCGLKPGSQIQAPEDHQNAPSRHLWFYSKDIFEIFPEWEQVVTDAGITPTGRTKYRKHELGFLCRVDSIEVSIPEEPIEVYNLEVEEDHTYIANSIAVHNCVGHATDGSCETRLVIAGTPITHRSPVWVYDVARCIERARVNVGVPNESLPALADNGSEPSDAWAGIERWGIAAYADRPTSNETANDEPKLGLVESASALILTGAFRIDSTGAARVTAMKTALANGYPIAIAVQVDAAFENWDGVNPLGAPDPNSILGGHYIYVSGYETLSNGSTVFSGPNSWTSAWGQGGFWAGDESFIAGADDIYAADVRVAS
jgi:intein/homing endonuclease